MAGCHTERGVTFIMLQEVEAQLHFWPWSTGNREETVDLSTEGAVFPFYGSPVISLSSTAFLILPQRHERFAGLGPKFVTTKGQYQLYETPHGVLASTENKKQKDNFISVKYLGNRVQVKLSASGARTRQIFHEGETEPLESDLSKTVLAWSQFFDDIIEEALKNWNKLNTYPWSEILNFIDSISVDVNEPRMALIVKIAEQMHHRISHTVNAARKVLIRERQMMPAGRVAETDTTCLRWYIRQPGETMAQKAAGHRQSLLGVARVESYNTLENRVLKDFLFRCRLECNRYIDNEVGKNLTLQRSRRAGQIRSYKNLCSNLKRNTLFDDLHKPPPGTPPNYVLRNDFRYREVWRNYVRLIKREDEEDRLWDWQSRTWADVVRFLVNATLYSLTKEHIFQGSLFSVKEMFTSTMHLFKEQHLGSRVEAGSEPGPFIIKSKYLGKRKEFVLEVVHSSLANQHIVTQDFGRLGGHLYLVLTPLAGGKRTVIIIWGVHTASSDNHPEWKDICKSAEVAVDRHIIILGERTQEFPNLYGFIVASDLEQNQTEMHFNRGDNLFLLQVSSDQRSWNDAIAGISLFLEDFINNII